MAIELYPNLNYLLVLDYYDDITLFDDDVLPETVSYYQMKTSEDSISIDTAISEDWIDNHLTCNIFRYNKNDRVNTELHIGMLWKIYINRRRLQCLGNR